MCPVLHNVMIWSFIPFHGVFYHSKLLYHSTTVNDSTRANDPTKANDPTTAIDSTRVNDITTAIRTSDSSTVPPRKESNVVDNHTDLIGNNFAVH